MKKFNLCKRIMSCAIVLSMALSTSVPAFAEITTTTINYVSLGDSMTNGYGLEGYNGNNGVLDYGNVSYANQFADWLENNGYADTVNHYQLAMSGCRAEDLHWLLEFDHNSTDMRNFVNRVSRDWEWNEDEWYSVFNIGDYRTRSDMCGDDNRCSAAASNILASGYVSPYAIQAQIDAADCLNHGTGSDGGYVHYTNENQVPIVTEYLQTAIKDADIISMAVGNSNFGTFMFDQIVNAVGYSGTPADAMRFSIERALTECPAEIKAGVLKLKDELYSKIEEYLNIELDYDLSASDEENMMAAIANAAVYAGISYVLNYAGAVDAILRLNPDVEIILVGLMNTYLTENSSEQTIGSLLEVIFPPLNAYIAALPTVMKALNNGVYKDATFYYAEAPEVACMVEVYGTDFYNQDGTSNRGSITRQRFFRDLMGIMRGMIGNRDSFGAPLNYNLPFEELCRYDDMDDTGKAAYAYADRSNAITCAIYLAFEHATLSAGRESSVSLGSILDLGDTGISQFEGVLDAFRDNLESDAPEFAPDAFAAIATIFNDAARNNYGLVSEVTANNVATVYLAEDANKLDEAKTIVQTIVDDTRNEDTIEAMAQQGVYDRITDANYSAAWTAYATANSIPYTWEQIKAVGGDTYNSFVAGVRVQAWADNSTEAISTTKATIVNGSADILVSAAGYVDGLCQLLALPNALGTAMAEDDKATSWFGLTGRVVIGGGLGGHPAAAGHNSLFDAVKKSYSEGYTAKDETIKNVNIVKDVVSEYYDEAYELAYSKADENGYIDIAVGAVENILNVVKTLNLDGIVMTDDFKTKLNAEIEAVVTTLEKVKYVLAEDKASNVDGLLESVSVLFEDIQNHLANVRGLLDQVGVDIKLELAKGTHKTYTPDSTSYYVAIGGDTVIGTTDVILSGEQYYKLVAEEYEIANIKPVVSKFVTPTEALGLIETNKAEIEKADLITYQIDASSIIKAILSETPDWDAYLTADEQALVEEIFEQTKIALEGNWADYANANIQGIIPEIKAAVVNNLPENIPFAEAIFDIAADVLVQYMIEAVAYAESKKNELNIPALDQTTLDYAEKLAYAVVSYAVDTKNAIEKIQGINPDATLVVVGMYNPARGLKIEANDGVLDIEEYVEYVIDITNAYYTALAAVNDGFAFVDVSDAETDGFVDPINLSSIASVILNASDKMHANEAGHKTIAEKIIASFTCVPGAYEQLDATHHTVKCVLCGKALATELHNFDNDTCTKCGYTKPAPTPSPSYGGSGAVANQFTIKFNTNGGSKIANATVKKGELIEKPADPTKDGYTFDGWYTDSKLTKAYDFETPVTKSFTLYAKWTKIETDASTRFTDVSKDAWYYDVVNEIVERGLMVGLTDTEFGPQTTLTRGMFVTVLYRVEGEPAVEGEIAFTDIAADQYYAEAVKWANANGLVSGVTETEFAPNKEVTREQMAAIIARYVEFKAIEVPEEGEATYTDSDAIEEYAKDAVLTAKKLGILVGNADGSFAPKSNATRAEAAALFVRLLGIIEA